MPAAAYVENRQAARSPPGAQGPLVRLAGAAIRGWAKLTIGAGVADPVVWSTVEYSRRIGLRFFPLRRGLGRNMITSAKAF